MQAFGLRRLACSLRQYSTAPALPEAAQVARTASAPLAVRLRRRNKFGPLQTGQTDADPSGLTPSEVARYNRLKALSKIPLDKAGEPISALQWIRSVNDRRSRIRGFALEKQEDGSQLVKVVGQRVYLPNIEFKLVRNHTLAGEPYNPYEATFRIPKSVTKTDIRSYLDAVYGVKTTYIRTDNYYSPEHRVKGKTPHRSYKRTVVGLVDPFYYPHRLEDMAPEKKEERKKWMETEFSIEAMDALRREEMLRQTIGHGSAAFRATPGAQTRRSHILKLVAERKVNREALVSQVAAEIREKRANGEDVSYEALAKSTKPAKEVTKS
ncbi:hypothetical protein D9611_012494 [Ephemerocybe angulata]|uniref:Large ribosomal subunit protein uL23m n=2 Tax=Ephemerocybe angulata TaxID=980116 RepID=A0A8H5CBF3_9AGAR|nr:hypothetical protein D9611_012494 [Tulosesus angulatus]KAF6761673.1 hypothetical protein DFP72DRAFT_958645 [Tulosesus angulatus]